MKKGKRICSFALALVLCMGSLPGMASAAMKSVKITQKGQVVDSITFNGVTVNAIYAPPNSISGYSSDATYCCAAFVSKFYRQVYGIGVGHLSRKYNGPYVYSGSGSFSKTNDPQVGDILWNLTSKTTHWAIVKEVGSTDVTVIEQNGWYKKAEGTARVGKTYSKTSPSVTFYHYNPGSTNVSGGTTSGENVSVAFSNYQVRKLTETSAEPYATATATNGLVKKVGMRIGTNKDKLQLLGSDNGKAGIRKNMWYNTTKYNYPLQPGTTYYYQPFAEVDGKEYPGDIRSFTTPGTKPTQKEETKSCSHSYNSRGYCSKCGQEYPMTITYLIPAATYEAVKNDVPVRNRPYAPEEIIKSLSKGEKVSVAGYGNNSVGNLWYKLSDGTWVYSENLKQSTQSAGCNGNHTKGEYLFYEALHPHKVYWKCAVCGEKFTDGSTEKMPSCEICNPKPSPVTFSNYQVRKLTATSAEPYATAKVASGSGKVARVGMYIGTSRDSLQLLGTDNGTPKALKNMWYNTTKYNYPLQSGRTYYYQPFAEVDGTRYYGEIHSFTTP